MGGRLDTWVFGVSIAIPLLCIAVLVLWHLVTGLLGKLAKKRKTFRHSPEPLHEQRIRHARELLTLSEEESCKQRFLGFLERCEALAATFPDLPEAGEATQLAAQIKNDLKRLQEVCSALVNH